MGMQRELEITVLSAANLKRRYCLGTAKPSYAVLWIDSHSKVPAHIADHGPNSAIRMLCRESLFGTAAKAKLFVEIFHKLKVAGTANVLLSELQSGLLWGSSTGESAWSEPKRMTLDLRRLRAGSYQREKVIGTVDIQVRVGTEAANRIADGEAGTVVYYNGLPIQLERGEFVPRGFESFVAKSPALSDRRVETAGGEAHVYYQHAPVEKPKAVWRGIHDQRQDGTMGVLALGVFS